MRRGGRKASNCKVDSTGDTTALVLSRAPSTQKDELANLTHESALIALNVSIREQERLTIANKTLEANAQATLETGLADIRRSLDEQIHNLQQKVNLLFEKEDQNKVFPRQRGNEEGRGPRRKIFIPQESELTMMLHNSDENYRTIFNIALAVLFLWGTKLAFADYTSGDGIKDHFALLSWGLYEDITAFWSKWTLMLACSFLIVPLAHCMAESKKLLSPFLVLVYIAFQIGAFWFSAVVVSQKPGQAVGSQIKMWSMPLAVAFMAEQCRMSMKMHAYMREKVMWYQHNGEHSCKPQSSSYMPILGLAIPEPSYFWKEVEKYFYFLFAPTLIYRDEYPRTTRTRWVLVFFYMLQAVGIIYYAFLIFRELLPEFRNTAGQPASANEIIRHGFSCMGPAMTCMFFTHFLVLHLVQNLFAELTRFADRKFYGDWWNSRTYAVFYRKWNGVVHDFIHSYIYSDLVQFCKVSRLTALLSAFIISAIIHEYLICIAMGFFLPILGVLFTGPGLIFILLTKNATGRAWNIFMWITLSTGNAMLMVLYVREFFARASDTTVYENDFFIPRTYRIQFPYKFA